MVKQTMAFALGLVCLCLALFPLPAQALTTGDARETLDPQWECSLTLIYRYGDTCFAQVPVTLYRVADFSADGVFTLTSAFAPSRLNLMDITSANEWTTVRSTLEAYILSARPESMAETCTDDEGQAVFSALPTGLYLAIPGDGVSGDMTCVFDPALITLPLLGEDGLWQYEAAAKTSSPDR